LAHNADINAKTNDGKTPLDLATGAWRKNKEVIEFLRQHGGKRAVVAAASNAGCSARTGTTWSAATTAMMSFLCAR